jgi:hypothetical protein
MITQILAEVSTTAMAITVCAILGGITLTSIIIIFGLRHAQRTQELWHETARLALEKGQPLPPTPDELRQRTARERFQDDFRNGLVMVATGVGLYLFLNAFIGKALAYVGAIPFLVGLAMLLHAGLSAWFNRKQELGTKQSPLS